MFDKVDIRVSTRHFLVLARSDAEPNLATNNNAPECGHQTKRLGIIVAKKHVKLAKDRNRLKRLIRESFRNSKEQLSGLDLIVLAKRGAGEIDNSQCFSDFRYLLKKLAKKQQVLMSSHN